MPRPMKMVIHNGNPTASQIRSMEITTNAVHQKAKVLAPKALNSSMIARIHNIKPGCGGCGRG